jgi:hypothetical protein
MIMTSLEKEPLSVDVCAIASVRPLAGIELDDTQTAMLLSITRLHCKLGVEHGKTCTTSERRREIMDEIQSLCYMRDDLIAEWRNDKNI